MYKNFWIIFLLLGPYSAFPCPSSFTGPLSKIHYRHSVDNERSLLARGFPSYYVNRFDESVQLVKLKQGWIKKEADPEITHIPYFARKIPAHIKETRKGIMNSELQDFEKHARLRALKDLEREASLAKRTSKVTSTWWNIFNIRLIALVTFPIESAFNLGLSLTQIQDYQVVYRRLQETKGAFNIFNNPYIQMMEAFPHIVLVPAIGEIGPMAFNQTMSEHIHFIGVSGVDVEVDGKMLTPQDYFRHDGEHAESIEAYLKKQDSGFHARFKRRKASLPTVERIQQELAYYLLLRERGILRGSNTAVFQRNFNRMLRYNHIINLLPADIRNGQYEDKEEYKQVLQEYFRDMESNYNALSQEIRTVN